MVKNLLATFCLIFLVSCNCQRTTNKEKSSDDKQISSDKIKVFLREKNFDIVSSANLVVVFDITKKLIEGTTDEYSNKLVLKDTLANEKANELLALLVDDTSYDWTENERTEDFNPGLQFLVRNDTERIFLLVDKKNRRLGFINLEGQKIVELSKNLIDYFDRIP